MYGRGREIATLIDAFERVARDGRQSLVLVSGYSGVGKSSVVNELQEIVVRGHGLFASGKFEPYERDTPLAPIIRPSATSCAWSSFRVTPASRSGAKISGGHSSARESLLSEEHWESNYALRFSLALYRSECEFLTGELAAADERLSRLRERAMSSTDLAAVTSLRITVNITMNRTDRAIEVGLQHLRAFGIEWSSHPSEDEVQAEHNLLRRRLGEHPIETVAELASTRDPDLLAVMQILREMLPAAVFIDKNLHDLAVLRMVNLSLEHGHCDSSPQAFAQLSMVVGPRFGHCDDGFRFGNLGMALAERGDLARFRGKVYVVAAYHALPWTAPVRDALGLMRRALALTQEAGDMQFATFSASM